MKTRNKAQLIGYLGADPQVFQTPTGRQYAILRLATDQRIPTKDPHPKKRTAWHQVKIWGASRMPFVQNNFMKGSHVLVEGMIDYYTIQRDKGRTEYKMEIKADYLLNLDR